MSPRSPSARRAGGKGAADALGGYFGNTSKVRPAKRGYRSSKLATGENQAS